MAATVNQLNVLAGDNAFRERVRSLVLMEAATFYAGAPGNNKTFAIKLMTSPELASGLASILVTRTNLVASNVSYDFDRRAFVTDATDAAIRSQINTDWPMLAGT